MKKYSQIPPILISRSISYWLQGRVHFPKDQLGAVLVEQEQFAVFRKMILRPSGSEQASPGAIFKVYFRFARFSKKINRILSLIPIPLILAQPGFRSKTWLFGKDTDTFQGLYEWNSVEDAEHYWNSLPLRLMKKRAVPDSLRYEITAAEKTHT